MLKKKEKLAIFIPLFIYAAYVLNLIFLNRTPFLIRWLEGCFGLFVALVFCNLIKRHYTTKSQQDTTDIPEHKINSN